MLIDLIIIMPETSWVQNSVYKLLFFGRNSVFSIKIIYEIVIKVLRPKTPLLPVVVAARHLKKRVLL